MDVKKVGKSGRSNRPSRRRKRYHYSKLKNSVNTDVDTDITATAPVEIVPELNVNIDCSSSSKKLKTIPVPVLDGNDAPECYVFMNTNLMVTFMEKLSKCPKCGDGVTVIHDVARKKGFVHFIRASCLSAEKCDWTETLASSKTVVKKRSKDS